MKCVPELICLQKSAKNKTEFMKLLRHERMIELAFEGHRFLGYPPLGIGYNIAE